MSEGAAFPLFPTMTSLPPDEDPIFGFRISKWFEPSEFTPNPPETSEERYKRLHDEAEYRHSTNQTLWHRYATLGRYVVDGNTFDLICKEYEDNPIRLHLVIWFQYMYHVDRKMDIPDKLDDWATKRSQAYLAIHAPSALHLDTFKVSWKIFSNTKPVFNPWKTVGSKSRQKTKQKSTTISANIPKAIQEQSVTPTIVEEMEEKIQGPVEPSPAAPLLGKNLQPQKTPIDNNSTGASSDGKVSALIPNLNVPVNDGTMRITLRWHTKVEVSRLSKNSSQMTASIYDLLTELFNDEDGLLYKWDDEGMEHFNSISTMSPAEVRSFISPSITIIPSQSMVIVPLRFGFSGKNSSSWRNHQRTKAALDRNNVTVGMSNSKSTSGKLVIAGYILLKAPRTTHRLRYLQSLRSKLPDTTPAFDILLYRRTPLEQDINHLVVQCGEHHVHPLSQALLTPLDGSGAGVYIPRFAFASMSREQAMTLFEKHDSYIKALRFIPLSPMINNLDTLRTEYFPDGTTIERSVRDWASTILSVDGKESAHCDVVNGGYDQKSFLLMAPQHEVIVKAAFEDYRRRVFPFTLREERFRETIGPPPSVIHVDLKVRANLQFVDKLSSVTTNWKESDDTSYSEAEEASSNAYDISQEQQRQESERINTEADSQKDTHGAKKPPTPLESLQRMYQQRSTDNTIASSTSSQSGSDRSRQSMLSTSSARFIELEARITRQQTDFDRKDKISSERLSQIERQLHRFDEVDTKLDTMKSDIDRKIDGSQKAQTAEIQNMSGQILTVMEKQVGFGASINILSDKISLLMGLITEKNQAENPDNNVKLRRSSPNASRSAQLNDTTAGKVPSQLRHTNVTSHHTPRHASDVWEEERSVLSNQSSATKSSSTSSTGSEKLRSPEKKKQRPVTFDKDVEYDNEEIEDDIDMEGLQGESEAMINSNITTVDQVEDSTSTLHDKTNTQPDLDIIPTDLESRYNKQHSSDQGDES
jgi:hypothetical protein